jgi:tetratricopeptide (TPR) repeat protein
MARAPEADYRSDHDGGRCGLKSEVAARALTLAIASRTRNCAPPLRFPLPSESGHECEARWPPDGTEPALRFRMMCSRPCRSTISGLWALLVLVLACPSLGAQERDQEVQELPLKRELPPGSCEARPSGVTSAEAPLEEDRREAERLSSEANRAAILGDREGALDLLRQAAGLDPRSPEIAYRLGRALEDAGYTQEALTQLCRYLALDPEGPDAGDVRDRTDRMTLSSSARAAFEAGIAAFDDGAFEAAARHFSRAIEEEPDWDDAHFNRGMAYLRAGRLSAGAEDLEWYLDTDPGTGDREVVRALLGRIAPALRPSYSPAVALTTGLLIPGMGQFYAGRPGLGALVLPTAGASAGMGLTYRRVEVDCLEIPTDGECPPDQVAERRVERPLRTPGLLGAAAATLFGAIHAFRGARPGGDVEGLSVRSAEAGLVLSGGGSGRATPAIEIGAAPWWDGGGARLTFEIRF